MIKKTTRAAGATVLGCFNNDKLLDKVSDGVQGNELNLKAQLKLYIGLCPFCNRPSIEIFGTVHKNARRYNCSAYIE